jgi:hypothetical protein
MGPCPELPRRRSRLGRREDYQYAKYHVIEEDLDRATVEHIERNYAKDCRLYHQVVVRRYVRNGRLLALYDGENRAHSGLLVYHLGTRGFFAELTTVARAMIYARIHQRQAALFSEQFSYRRDRGWSDYFETSCREHVEGMECESVVHCHSEVRGPGTIFDSVRGFQPSKLTIGDIPIRGFQNILGTLTTMIFRLNAQTAAEVDRRIAELGLPEDYACVHIRRGDKVGDEDIYYQTELYLDRLEDAGALTLPIFVLSDSYETVVEVRDCLAARGGGQGVYTLCDESHTGFNISALRGERPCFSNAAPQTAPDADFREFIAEETLRLLTETVIASRSRTFVGTLYSNIGKAIRYLHQQPEECCLLTPDDLGAARAS